MCVYVMGGCVHVCVYMRVCVCDGCVHVYMYVCVHVYMCTCMRAPIGRIQCSF